MFPQIKQKLKKMMWCVTKMKEWLEEMELEVEEDVGVVQNTQLEQETETCEDYLPLEMNDAWNNNVSWFFFFFFCSPKKGKELLQNDQS